MATGIENQDGIRHEKREWHGALRPEVAVVTTAVMLTALMALIALFGWLIAG